MRKIEVILATIVLAWAMQSEAKDVSDIFEPVFPSVVVIKTFDTDGKNVSLGSGVALTTDEVVTNCHLLEDGQSSKK